MRPTQVIFLCRTKTCDGRKSQQSEAQNVMYLQKLMELINSWEQHEPAYHQAAEDIPVRDEILIKKRIKNSPEQRGHTTHLFISSRQSVAK